MLRFWASCWGSYWGGTGASPGELLGGWGGGRCWAMLETLVGKLLGISWRRQHWANAKNITGIALRIVPGDLDV